MLEYKGLCKIVLVSAKLVYLDATIILSRSTLWVVKHTATIRITDACVLCKQVAKAASLYFPHRKQLQLFSSAANRDTTCNGSINSVTACIYCDHCVHVLSTVIVVKSSRETFHQLSEEKKLKMY